MLQDQEYFAQYLKSFEAIYNKTTEDCVYVKDIHFKYRFMTSSMLEIVGFTNLNEVKNQTNEVILNNLLLNETSLGAKLARQDESVCNSKNRGTYLEILPKPDGLRLIMLNKTPIINPDSGNVVGISGRISDMIWPSVIKTLFNIHGAKGLLVNHKTAADPLETYPINNIQHMVLFLCIHNYSYSEIALFMNEFGYEITPIRVNDYLEQLKLIFHVRTKTQLIEKTIGLNFHVLLPCGLFNNINSIDVKKDTAKIICCDCRLKTCTLHGNDQ